MKKFLFLLLALCPLLPLCAEVVVFRSGVILAAELTSVKQPVDDFDEADFPELPRQNRIYASVTLFLFPGRSLSRFDFVLNAFGTDCKCVATRTGTGPWRCRGGDITAAERDKKYALLFILDGRVAGINATERLKLKCNFGPAKYAETGIVFTNRRGENFTVSEQISPEGILAPQK